MWTLMDNPDSVLEETRSTLDRQITELRDQRHQALRVLRMYFAVAAILIAAVTTLLTASISFPFNVRISEGRVVAPAVILIGILLVGRGIIRFYRGIYDALEVLSVKSVDKHIWLNSVWEIVSVVIGKELSGRETYHAALGPDFERAKSRDNVTEGLIDENISCIKKNSNTIEANNEHLRRMYERMSGGITGFGIGIAMLFLGL